VPVCVDCGCCWPNDRWPSRPTVAWGASSPVKKILNFSDLRGQSRYHADHFDCLEGLTVDLLWSVGKLKQKVIFVKTHWCAVICTWARASLTIGMASICGWRAMSPRSWSTRDLMSPSVSIFNCLRRTSANARLSFVFAKGSPRCKEFRQMEIDNLYLSLRQWGQ